MNLTPAVSRLSPRTGGRLRRAATAATLAAGTAAALLTVTTGPAQASWYSASIGNTAVTLRDCYHPSKAAQPSQSCTAIKTVPAGTPVHIICQHSGQSIYGDPVWNYISYSGGEGYVADYYTYTGYANWIPGVDVCNY
ncbi:SH3 domain-containing protein [Micromonospora carbonacea]|uniref:SH3 domain-containing protein n=1 Tax=Micromonospora carbonacea TaxID=47853 RepID=UPI0037167AEB